MNLAVISPFSMLEKYSTNYHLVLTQYYLSSPTYRDFYVGRRIKGDFIILDNGAAELKASVDGKDMMSIVKELQPNIVVAPDVIYNKDLTTNLTSSFLGLHFSTLHSLGVMIMGVPQGGSKHEWYECYARFNEEERLDWLGISMFYTPKFSRRFEALRAIASTVQKPCHLLGLWDDPYELTIEKEFGFVQSVDTAKAVEFGLEGLKLSEWANHKHIDDDWYFGLNEVHASLRGRLVEENIRELREIVR